MTQQRYDVLDRFADLVRAPEPELDTFLRVRDRRRRTQRITAAGVALMVCAATVLIVATSHPSDREQGPAVSGPSGGEAVDRGFVTLPPEGATPSGRATSNLVISVDGWIGGPLYRAWIFEDGRMIWFKRASLSYGANDEVTGYLEQRLTMQGVVRFRDEVLATGLFDHDLALLTRGTTRSGTVRVRNGDRVVTLTWDGVDVPGTKPAVPAPTGAIPATASQDAAIRQLEVLFTHPEPSWIPANSWADPAVRPYVASRYAYCATGLSAPIRASEFLGDQTGAAANLLRQTRPIHVAGSPNDRWCWVVSTAHAQLLELLLSHVHASVDESAARWGVYYRLQVPSNEVEISFEPVLPDGEFVCTACERYGAPLPPG
jgi:hypothetical protein